MANTLAITIYLLLCSTTISLLGSSTTSARHIVLPGHRLPTHDWFKNLNLLAEEEKATRLHFYVHDNISGPNQTVYNVAESSITDTTSSWFGRVQVVDHLLTAGPEPDSEKVGRVQGIHFLSDLQVAAIVVNWNFLFNDGSTITVVGRLVAFDAEGELSIVGGTGEYLMARGVALKTTLFTIPDTLNSVMEYNLCFYTESPSKE